MKVSSVSKLSDIIGVRDYTIHRALKRPGAPKKDKDGNYDVDACRAFIESISGGRPRDKINRPPDAKAPAPAESSPAYQAMDDAEQIVQLRKRELEEKVKKLEIDNAIKSDQIIEISEAVNIFSEFAMEWRKVIENSGLDEIEKDRCFQALVRATDKLDEKFQNSRRRSLENA